MSDATVDALSAPAPVPNGAVGNLAPPLKVRLLPDPVPAGETCDGVKSPRTGSLSGPNCPGTEDWFTCAVDETNGLGVKAVLANGFGVEAVLVNALGAVPAVTNGLGVGAALKNGLVVEAVLANEKGVETAPVAELGDGAVLTIGFGGEAILST